MKLKTNLVAIFILLFLTILVLLSNSKKNTHIKQNTLGAFNSTSIIKVSKTNVTIEKYTEDLIDFEGFDNINGSSDYIVPDYVHLLFLQAPYIKFYQLINIFSIYLNHRPSCIYFHCDNCSFYGKYFKILREYDELWSIIRINKIPFKKTIFNKTYGWINHHRSDIWRLQVLMHYGGIYIDNDVYVIKSLHHYRKYELVLSWDSDDDGIGVQVIIAHRNARFLKTHFDSYRYNYTPSIWYWNAGFYPAKILLQHKYLAHIVKYKLGTQNLVNNLYKRYWKEWQNELDCVHLLINHRHYMDKESSIKEFNETNIQTYNFTYGYMVRDVIKRADLIFRPS